jgi:protein phosphatase
MIHVAALSLQGKRPSNQDRIFVTPNYQSGGVVAAVADGLGGMKDGDKAAEIAVATLGAAADALISEMTNDIGEARLLAAETYERANDQIGNWAKARLLSGAVGSTLVTLIVSDSRYLVVNVGDSRCYAIDETGVRQITQDHTVADTLVRQGYLAQGDYESSPLRNSLTHSLGPRSTCEPDLFPNADFGTLQRNCTFLLCSDGFYSKLKPEDLLHLAEPSSNLSEVLESLAAEALSRESSDNLSAVAVRFENA